MDHDPIYERIRQLVTATATELDGGAGIGVPEIVEEVMQRHADSIGQMVHGLVLSVLSESYEEDAVGDETDDDGVESVEGELS